MTSTLKRYKVEFTNGTTSRGHGKWAAHAWANARAIWPAKQIQGLSVLQSDGTPQEVNL